MVFPTSVTPNETTPLLTISEAAEFLHVHTNTLRRWSDASLLASYRICSRGDRRFLREDILRFVADYMYDGSSTPRIVNKSYFYRKINA